MAAGNGEYPNARRSRFIGRPAMETWVYQFRSDTELLYVGKSYRLEDRISTHRRTRPWWPEVTEIRKEQFATEDDAREREKEIWAAERPKYNKISPLRTPEEEREQQRRLYVKYRQQPGGKEKQRKQRRERYWIDPEYRERILQHSRERRRRLRSGVRRPWRQEGPGLF
jgi:hypothetical protein